jgi:hypothetical protein
LIRRAFEESFSCDSKAGQQLLSFTPGFSRVVKAFRRASRFNGLSARETVETILTFLLGESPG